MIPLWTIPFAIVTGNTLILKPSERDPGASMIIAELCKNAGTFVHSDRYFHYGTLIHCKAYRLVF